MSIPLVDTRTYIETPECVDLTFRLAGPGMRMGAYLLDLVIRIGIIIVVNLAISLLIGVTFGTLASVGLGAMMIVMFVIEWGYGSFFEGFWNGQTPGKRVFGLRVLKTGGYPIHFYDATIRNLLRAADILPICYAFGVLSMIATRRQQRLGDLVAGTMVVIEKRDEFVKTGLKLSKVPRLLSTDCTRRYHVSERTLEIVERIFDKRRALSTERREEIARILAQAISKHIGYNYRTVSDADRPAVRRFGPATWFLMRILATFGARDESATPYDVSDQSRQQRRPSESLAT